MEEVGEVDVKWRALRRCQEMIDARFHFAGTGNQQTVASAAARRLHLDHVVRTTQRVNVLPLTCRIIELFSPTSPSCRIAQRNSPHHQSNSRTRTTPLQARSHDHTATHAHHEPLHSATLPLPTTHIPRINHHATFARLLHPTHTQTLTSKLLRLAPRSPPPNPRRMARRATTGERNSDTKLGAMSHPNRQHVRLHLHV